MKAYEIMDELFPWFNSTKKRKMVRWNTRVNDKLIAQNVIKDHEVYSALICDSEWLYMFRAFDERPDFIRVFAFDGLDEADEEVQEFIREVVCELILKVDIEII